MATTTHDRSTTQDRPTGAPPAAAPAAAEGDAPDGARRKPFRFRDLYWERKDGPVTMAERRRSALAALIGIPVFGAVVVGIQVWGRDREVEGSWYVAMGVATVIFAVVGFAFPRFSPSGWAHIHSTDWSKESRASKIVGIIAMLCIVALLVARTIWRMDG